MLKNKTILITGGTGTFGKNFVKFLLNKSGAKKIIVFSRDEFKQHQMQQSIRDPRIRYFIGDIRDLPRLQRALNKVDFVVHAAALKQVPTLEYNPFEAIKTNIIGSQNVIEAAIDQKVKKVLFISSDKAVQPINLYGATKLCGEKIFVAANSYAPNKTLFAAVRYGNVVGSRGSIIETLIESGKNGVKSINITDPKMTRFWLNLEQSFDLVMFALNNMEGGEIFIPKIPSTNLEDIFNAFAPNVKRNTIGLRPGEKMHEILITEDEARNTISLDKYYVIIPEINSQGNSYQKYYRIGKKLDKNFRFTSDTNKAWLTKREIKEKLKITLL